MLSAAIAQHGGLPPARDPVKGGKPSATEQRKTGFSKCSLGWNQSWVNPLSLLRGVPMFSLGPLLPEQHRFALRTDQGSYINRISPFLKRPDAHISTITCEMMLEPPLEGCWELWEDVRAASLNSGKVGGEHFPTDTHSSLKAFM